jgi:hypothetical protein
MVLGALVLGGGLTAPAVAQLPKPMKETELKAANARVVAGSEIRKLLLGNTSYLVFLADVGQVKAGATVPMFYRDERTRVQLLLNKAKQEASWWIEGNNVCLEQRTLNVGHSCYSMYQTSSGYYSCLQPAGDCPYLTRVVPGNLENL